MGGGQLTGVVLVKDEPQPDMRAVGEPFVAVIIRIVLGHATLCLPDSRARIYLDGHPDFPEIRGGLYQAVMRSRDPLRCPASSINRHNPWHMPPAFERGCEEGFDDLLGHVEGDDALADGDAVGVVVGAG